MRKSHCSGYQCNHWSKKELHLSAQCQCAVRSGMCKVQDSSDLNGLYKHAVCYIHSRCGKLAVHKQTDSPIQMQGLDASGKYHTSSVCAVKFNISRINPAHCTCMFESICTCAVATCPICPISRNSQ